MSVGISESTVGPEFDPKSWDMVGSIELSKQLVSGETLIDIASKRDDVVVLTADLGRPTRVHSFKERFPDRYFNFGIAERNMVSAAAGMAAAGLKPYVAGYACFLGVIAAEQIRTDVCYTNLPVRFLSTHSGIAMGFYGTSHHATEDIGILRSMANLTILAPIDAQSLRQTLYATVDVKGPVYLRLGRGRETPVYGSPIPNWRIGGSHELRAGHHASILATGVCVEAAVRASDEMRKDGICARVVDMYSLKPIDRERILEAARTSEVIISVEEHNVVGGLGAAVAEVLAEAGAAARLVRKGLPDEYSLLGPPTHLYRHYGIDADGIAQTVRASIT